MKKPRHKTPSAAKRARSASGADEGDRQDHPSDRGRWSSRRKTEVVLRIFRGETLASQKDNLTVYLMSVYSDKTERAWFEKAWAKTGKQLNMGGSCVRFRKLEDAALDVIGEAIRRVPAKAYVESYVRTLAKTGRGPDGKKLKAGTGAARKTVARKPAKTTARAKPKKVAKKSAKR